MLFVFLNLFFPFLFLLFYWANFQFRNVWENIFLMVMFTTESLSVVAGNFTPSFTLKFLSIFMYISGSNEPITLIWVSLESRVLPKIQSTWRKISVAGENFFSCRANPKKCMYTYFFWMAGVPGSSRRRFSPVAGASRELWEWSLPSAELEFGWCQFYAKVMTSEVEWRPTFTMGGYGCQSWVGWIQLVNTIFDFFNFNQLVNQQWTINEAFTFFLCYKS